MLVADPLQATCCTTSRSRVSAAAPIPVPTPVNRTASQKRTASGDWSVEGMTLPAAVGKDPGVVNFMGVFPQRLPLSGSETHHSIRYRCHAENHAQSLRHRVIFGGK